MPRRPDLEYLKAVNQAAPPADPQVLFLLMGQYANANLQAEGIEFLSARLREFDPRMSVANAEKAPHSGWLREVYYQLAKLARAQKAQAKDQEYLRLSGYTDFDRPILLNTPFSEELASGHAFCPRRIAELVPGRVYALSGFEFTEYSPRLADPLTRRPSAHPPATICGVCSPALAE
jgi:hypothetical protein